MIFRQDGQLTNTTTSLLVDSTACAIGRDTIWLQ